MQVKKRERHVEAKTKSGKTETTSTKPMYSSETRQECCLKSTSIS